MTPKTSPINIYQHFNIAIFIQLPFFLQDIILLDSEDLSCQYSLKDLARLSFYRFWAYKNYVAKQHCSSLWLNSHPTMNCHGVNIPLQGLHIIIMISCIIQNMPPQKLFISDIIMLHWIELGTEDLGRRICGGSIFLLIAQSLIFAQASHVSSTIHLLCIYSVHMCEMTLTHFGNWNISTTVNENILHLMKCFHLYLMTIQPTPQSLILYMHWIQVILC